MRSKLQRVVLAFLVATATGAAISQESSSASATAAQVNAEALSVDTFSFSGLRIGMSEQEVSSLFPKLAFKDRGPVRQGGAFVLKSDLTGDPLVEKEGDAILVLTLLQDRLVNISVRWLPKSFELMLPKLHKDLGTPLDVQNSQHVTEGGQAFNNTIATWTGSRTTIRYFQHFENIKQSRLLVMERPPK